MTHPDPIVDKIVVARIGLLLRHPFFGNMATRLKIKDASEWCNTAATDGRHLFYSRDFFEKLSAKQIEFVVAHEILHNVFDHLSRAESRNKQLWNIAIDYCVNGQLVRDKIGDHKFTDIRIYHDTQHYGKSAEQIYDELYDNKELDQLKKLGQLLDEHMEFEGDENGKGKPVYSKEELKKIRDEIREAVITAAQSAGAGNVPAEVQKIVKDLTEPKMNWRQILRQQIQSTIRNDYTFSRPSRKGWHVGAVLPGMNFEETIDLCISIDTSGSISYKQTQDFLSEIKGIMDEYKDYKIVVWSFDTKVHNMQTFDAQSGEDISEYVPTGGGGTEFLANWQFMRDNDIVPKKFIMFTDMYPWGSFGDPDYCDTIFINHGRPGFEAPFGITAEYSEQD